LGRSRGAVVFLLLLAACGSNVEAGVNVKSVATDLVYGIPEEVIPAAPANIGTPPDDPIGIVYQDTAKGEQTPSNSRPPPAPACPVAGADKFPEPALSTVKGRPLEGEYMWRVEGFENTSTLGKLRLPRTSRRQITGVATTSGEDFQYVIAEQDLRFGARTTIKTTYEVRQDDGLYITRIERETEGGSKALFQPTPAVEILPLPATIGADISGTGVDANTLEVLRVTGTVPKRQRIDACGDPVDSFFVDGTQEFISAAGESNRRNWDYGVATALGGQIVLEHVEAPCSSEDADGKCTPAPTLTFDAHLGQIKPDKLD
jgi:hypothetical protein